MSLHYLLRGTIQRGAELYSPCKEVYGMLKEAVVGGQSLVSTRYHEADVTCIRPHQFKKPRVCERIISYDANMLYLSTVLREMPCGNEQVIHYQNPADAASIFTERLKAGTWFGLQKSILQSLKSFG